MKWDGNQGGDPSGGNVICKSAGRSFIYDSKDGFQLHKVRIDAPLFLLLIRE
jgi:hypothetical protein